MGQNILVLLYVGGGKLRKFIHLGSATSSNKFIGFVKNLINLFTNNTELKITVIKVFTGILDITKGNYNK